MIGFAMLLQLMRWQPFLIVAILLGIGLAWRGRATFLSLARRARWLLVSIALIYAYATPGEFVGFFPDAIAPTFEGLHAGAMQMGRLALMLAALALLLETSSREDIICGVFQLLGPLQLLGLDPERFSARLWLTLQYVETMPRSVFKDLIRQGWNVEALSFCGDGPDRILLKRHRVRATDYLVLLVLPIAFWLVA